MAPHQPDRLLRRMVIFSSSNRPMMNFGEGESQIVEFSPAFPNHGAFFYARTSRVHAETNSGSG